MNIHKIQLNLSGQKKEETSPEISFIAKELPSEKHHESTKKLPTTILVIVAFVMILITLITLLYQSENYYLGEWRAELTSEEKKAGFIESMYIIADDSIQITTKSDINGIISTTSIKYILKLLDKKSAAIIFEIESLEVTETQVLIPLNLCNNDKTQCDKLQDKFKRDFKQFIEKQNQNYKGKTLRLSPNKDKLRFIILGEREIVLSKK